MKYGELLESVRKMFDSIDEIGIEPYWFARGLDPRRATQNVPPHDGDLSACEVRA